MVVKVFRDGDDTAPLELGVRERHDLGQERVATRELVDCVLEGVARVLGAVGEPQDGGVKVGVEPGLNPSDKK